MRQNCFDTDASSADVHLRRPRSYFPDYGLQMLPPGPKLRTPPRILRMLVTRRLKNPKTPPPHHHKSGKKHSPTKD